MIIIINPKMIAIRGIKKSFLNFCEEIKINKNDKINNPIDVLSPLNIIITKAIIVKSIIRKLNLFDFFKSSFHRNRKINNGKNLAV